MNNQVFTFDGNFNIICILFIYTYKIGISLGINLRLQDVCFYMQIYIYTHCKNTLQLVIFTIYNQ
jgi:hypothetical protein